MGEPSDGGKLPTPPANEGEWRQSADLGQPPSDEKPPGPTEAASGGTVACESNPSSGAPAAASGGDQPNVVDPPIPIWDGMSSSGPPLASPGVMGGGALRVPPIRAMKKKAKTKDAADGLPNPKRNEATTFRV